ncbi:uncharacterized protein LOC115884396 [Sitophilus oryzae]|uniref:Uncharacterized protein LOC115884396 n=1 Tax=Sitophilus oryzae TaxID=7048 RepID=A0A6J2Y6W5_SITOR|nr:uncharacterized protein LOC115884396 [Sitophilus oryzae]
MLKYLFALLFVRLIQCGTLKEARFLNDAMSEHDLAYYFQTTDRDAIPDYEVVHLPVEELVKDDLKEENDDEGIEYSFSAFQRPINLKLKKNTNILGTTFKTYIHEDDNVQYLNQTPLNCHYLHEDEEFVAALSMCTPKAVVDLIRNVNCILARFYFWTTTFEIHPLTPKLQRLVKRDISDEEPSSQRRVPHIIKRARFAKDFLFDDLFPTAGNLLDRNEELNDNIGDIFEDEIFQNTLNNNLYRRAPPMTVELALFFDEAAYKIFGPYFGYDDRKLQNMLLAYINGVSKNFVLYLHTYTYMHMYRVGQIRRF